MTVGDQIDALRREARGLREQADRLDAQAITLMATEHARAQRELRLMLEAVKAAAETRAKMILELGQEIRQLQLENDSMSQTISNIWE